MPFYYTGPRGSVVDPLGGADRSIRDRQHSPRIAVSRIPDVDALLQPSARPSTRRSGWSPLRKAMALITEEAPAHFMWRHQMAVGAPRRRSSTTPGGCRRPRSAPSRSSSTPGSGGRAAEARAPGAHGPGAFARGKRIPPMLAYLNEDDCSDDSRHRADLALRLPAAGRAAPGDPADMLVRRPGGNPRTTCASPASAGGASTSR